ncbi:MAG: flagellar hook-basal body complex protein FliE [Candidatus Zixiibacteriota bacterium]
MSANIGQINQVVPGLANQVQKNQLADDGAEKSNFTDLFNNFLNSVNDLQFDSAKAQELLATGDAADLHQVMIAAEEAGIAMDLLLEIRNKLVDAYKTIMQMPM